MAGWEFREPVMLLWLVLGFLPVLIFRFFRPRPREISWGAMRFLIHAQKKAHRKTRFRDVMRLFFQTVSILGIILAAAQPVFRGNAVETEEKHLLNSDESESFHLILLDNSASMGAEAEKDGGEGKKISRLEKARQAALGQVRIWRRNGIRRILVLPTNPGIGEAEIFSREPEFCLKKIFLENDSADWNGALERAGKINGKCAEIRVFSDFGKNGVQKILEDFKIALPSARCHAVPVNSFSPNLSVCGFEMKETPVLAGQKQIVRVKVRNDSEKVSPPVCVNFKQSLKEAANGVFRSVSTEQKWCRVPGKKEFELEYEVNFPEVGEYFLSVEIGLGDDAKNLESDCFGLDNFRHLTVHAKEKAFFLIAESWNSEFQTEKNAASPYLRAVIEGIFSERFPEAGEKILGIDCRKDVNFADLDLSRYDAVFLCGISLLSPEEVKEITEYVLEGGGVCFFPGEDTNEKSLAGLENILPGVFSGEAAEAQEALRVVLPERMNEITEIFRRNPESGLENVPVFRWVPIKMNSGGERALELSNGSVLLAVGETRQGGRTVLGAIPADIGGSAFPLLPVWVPLVERTLHFLTSSVTALANGEEICPIEESRFLNQTLAAGEFPEGWEIQIPENLETAAAAEDEKTIWSSVLLLFSALAAGGAGLCVSREV